MLQFVNRDKCETLRADNIFMDTRAMVHYMDKDVSEEFCDFLKEKIAIYYEGSKYVVVDPLTDFNHQGRVDIYIKIKLTDENEDCETLTKNIELEFEELYKDLLDQFKEL